MRKVFRSLLIASLLTVPTIRAEVLELPTGDPAATLDVPSRGMSQAAVARRYGEPLRRHAPVGGGSPQQPPITRWDYDGWSVFYENNTVVDVVVKDAPAPVHNVDALRAAP